MNINIYKLVEKSFKNRQKALYIIRNIHYIIGTIKKEVTDQGQPKGEPDTGFAQGTE